MGRRSGRSCPGWSIARAATSITGAKTRIAPRASANIVCRGLNPRGMPNDFCPHMVPLPNTFALDGIGCLLPSTAKRCTTASRVGPKLQGQSGRPKGRVGEHRAQNASSAVRSWHQSQQLDNAYLFHPEYRVAQCISLQLHHPVNRGEVGAERGTPGLKAEEPADADPTAHEVQGLHDLLRCRSSLLSGVHVDLDMRDQVATRDTRDDDQQFFGFAV